MNAIFLIIIGLLFIGGAIFLIFSTKNRYRAKEVAVPLTVTNRDELDWNKGIPAQEKLATEEITKDINETSTATVGVSVPNF